MLTITKLSQIELTFVLRGFMLGLPVLIFIFAIQFLFQGWSEPAGRVYYELGWLRITRYSLHLISISLMRITSFIFLTSLLTMTSTITELTHAVESLLQPLRRFGVPAHELALMVTIALRFVPTLAAEMETIMKAQASRGADWGARRIWRPDKAAQAYLPLIVPLFINAFRRAEELIVAMEARCYVSGAGRTKFVVLKSRASDYLAIAGAFIFMLVMIFLPWPAVRIVITLFGFNGL